MKQLFLCVVSLLTMCSYGQQLANLENSYNARNAIFRFGLNINTTFGFLSKSIPSSSINQVKLKEFYVKDLGEQILRSNFLTQPFTHSNAEIGLFLELNTLKGKKISGLGYLLQANYGNMLYHYKDNVFSGKKVNAQLGVTYSFRKQEKSLGFGVQLLGGADYLLSYDLYEKTGILPTFYQKIKNSTEKFADFSPRATFGVFMEFSPGGAKLSPDVHFMLRTFEPDLYFSHKFKFVIGVNYDYFPLGIFEEKTGFISLNIKSTFAKPLKLDKK